MSLTRVSDASKQKSPGLKVIHLPGKEEKECVSRGGIWHDDKGCVEKMGNASQVGIWRNIEETIYSIRKSSPEYPPSLLSRITEQMEQAILFVCEMDLLDYNASVRRIIKLVKSVGILEFPTNFRELSDAEAKILRAQSECKCSVGGNDCPPGKYCQSYMIGSGEGRPGDRGRCLTRPVIAPPTPPTAPPTAPPSRKCKSDVDCNAGQHCADDGECYVPLRDCKPGEPRYYIPNCPPAAYSCPPGFAVCVDESACSAEGHIWADGKCDRSMRPQIEQPLTIEQPPTISPEQGECQKRGGIWGADGCIERVAVESKAVTSGGPMVTTIKWALVVGLGTFSLVYLLKSISGVSRSVKKRRSR